MYVSHHCTPSYGYALRLCVHAVPVVGSVRGCVEPCVRSLLSKAVDKDKKGEGEMLCLWRQTSLLNHRQSRAVRCSQYLAMLGVITKYEYIIQLFVCALDSCIY